MQGEASEVVGGFSIPSGCSIFSVANDRVSFIGEVDADLIFPSCQESDFQETESRGFFDDLIGGAGEFAFFVVSGGIDDEGLVLGEV